MGCSASRPVGSVVPIEPVPEYKDSKGPYFVTSADACAKIPLSSSGIASELGCPQERVFDLFAKCCEKYGDKTALSMEFPVPDINEDGTVPEGLPLKDWMKWTWAEYYNESEQVAKALIACGVERFQAVQIYGFNAPQWFMSSLGGIMAGALASGVYPTDNQDTVQYKCRHSNAGAVLLDDESKLEVIGRIVNHLPNLRVVVTWGFTPKTKSFTREGKEGKEEVPIYSWADFTRKGDEQNADELKKRQDTIEPGHCAALIYTSGTTGQPKAVMVSHDNIIFNGRQGNKFMGIYDMQIPGTPDKTISYLPLSHVAAMLLDIVMPVVVTSDSSSWWEVYFPRPYDLKKFSLGDRLRAVKPTVFFGVPRVWQKFAEKIQAIGALVTGIKKGVSTWAKSKNLEYEQNCEFGGTGKASCCCSCVAQKISLTIKSALGFENLKVAAAGAAPLSINLIKYFCSLGIFINNFYGMSESTGVATMTSNNINRWGTVGCAALGTEVKIFTVDPDDINNKTECPRTNDIRNPEEEAQGEICYRGRHIMMGYLANPDLGEEHVNTIKKKNEAAIDAEGWLHSGDKGAMDRDGFTCITGRYKELIIGPGGENIAPVPIEEAFKQICPAVSNIIMVGNNRKFNVCLVTLLCDGATGESPGTDSLTGAALEVSSDSKTVARAITDKKWQEYIYNGIKATNKTVANNAHKIQRFSILPLDFSSTTGELTATLKLKRGFVEKKHAELLDALYDADLGVSYVQCPNVDSSYSSHSDSSQQEEKSNNSATAVFA